MPKQPLYKHIQEVLRERIRAGMLRPGDLVASEKDLSSQFHVSQLTARNAISGLVDEGLVHRIQGKGTFVSESSVSMRTDTKTVGVVLPTMKTEIDKSVLNFIELHLAQSGFSMLLNISRESVDKESSIIQKFCSMGVCGLIVFPAESENYSEMLLQLSIQRFPLVLIDRYLKNARTPSVTSNNIQGGYVASNYLMDHGCERIGFISPEFSNTATNERKEGFEKALLERGRVVNHHLWCTIPLSNIGDEAIVNRLIFDYLKSHQNIDGLFIVNAYLADLTLQNLRKLNMHNSVQVIGFDRPATDEIPYIQQDVQTMCSEAVNILQYQMDTPGYFEKKFIDITLVSRPQSSDFQEQ